MRRLDLRTTSLGARICMCAVCALCFLPLAHAEQSSEEPSADAIETIFVTATRRTTDVQSVPIAIDVFGSDQLKESRIQSVEDLQFQTAGLKIAGGALVRISLRGIGPNSITPTSESGVGTFLDGVFLGNGYFQSRAFFDLERVELLRGPQGTLYGRDATVGAFNYVTKAPTSVFEAGGDMTYGNDNLIQTDGYVSGPLIGETLTGRLAFRTEKHDGYAENLEDNKGLDTGDNAEVRGRIAYQPTDALRIDLTADYSRDDGYAALEAFRSNPALPTLYEAVGGLLYGAAPMPGGRKVDQNLIRAGQIRTQGVSVKVAWDVDWATLTSITAERGAHQNTPSGDLDFTSAPLLDFTNQFDVEQYTEDLYLVSAGDGRLDWTLGASYFYEKAQTSGLLSVSPFLGGGTLLLDSPELKTEAYAVYGEATYRIFDKLALTGGVRYSWEEKKKSEADDCQSVTCAPPGLSAFDVSHSWDEWLPHVSLNYQASDDIMLYASVGRGFKAGGFNALTPQSTPYDPEESTTYEVGLKSELFDRILLLNVAAFSTDYDDLQVEQRVATPTPHLEIRNAASARVNGVELQLTVRPVEFLSIDGNAAYLDTEYRSFPAAVVDFQTAGPPVTFDASGNQLSQAPEWSANVGAQSTTPLSNLGQLTIRGEYAYQSDVFFTPANTSLFHQAGYNWFNARVSFETNDGRWNVAAWGKNLSDVSRFAYLAPGSPEVPGLSATVFGMMLPPRTYGATVGFKF